MAIHAVKVEDFHSKPPSCSVCRLVGRMAIHAVKVEDFHSNEISNVVNYNTIYIGKKFQPAILFPNILILYHHTTNNVTGGFLYLLII